MARVKESIGCFIVLGIIALTIWLAIRPKTPICSIEEFTVFALREKTTNSTLQNNNTIHYDLKVKNRRSSVIGIYYDALNVTFSYKRNHHSFPIEIGDAKFGPFYLRNYRSTHRTGSIDVGGVQLENDTVASSPVVFRVEVLANLRYKKPIWRNNRYNLLVGADVEVNDEAPYWNFAGQVLMELAVFNADQVKFLNLLSCFC
uniref:Late embryogenesis abundant protein LEA-2 subgroup domain-containing protein n=1 Tax=Chenopodium quinoa TaxID=63459 RepID=A0A803LYK1_CHEQI